MERLQSEATRLKTQQLKAAKDSEKYKEERDSVISEYRLIMSERDQVIKEVDRLQTGLEMAEAKLKNTSSQRRVANEELEALRQVTAGTRAPLVSLMQIKSCSLFYTENSKSCLDQGFAELYFLKDIVNMKQSSCI